MKVVILAGGMGTRISEESHLKPKPMIEIGQMPILWHIMKYYSHYGYNDFVICCGYKSFVIKEFFANYMLYRANVTIKLSENRIIMHENAIEPWSVTLVDTGLTTMTGGRIKRVRNYIGEEDFLLTYGDGVADININELVAFHNSHNKIATITAIKPSGRFGTIDISENNDVNKFREKSMEDVEYINGGFMVFRHQIFNYIEGDESILESDVLSLLSEISQVKAYRHNGFWQCMDNMRDKNTIEDLWNNGNAKWRVWEND